jgi:hypothetical protein
MRKIFWLLTMVACVLGGLYLLWTVANANRPEQKTAGILLSLATVIIPYVFTRSLEGMRHMDVQRVRIVPDRPPAPAAEPQPEEPAYVVPHPASR